MLLKPGRLISPPGTYFVTFSTWQRRRLFVVENYARLFLQTLYRYRREGRYKLHAFVLMPEHVHLLLTSAHDVTLNMRSNSSKADTRTPSDRSSVANERSGSEDSPITEFAMARISSITKTIFIKIPSSGRLLTILVNTDIAPPSRDTSSTSGPQRLKPKLRFQRALNRHEWNSCPSRLLVRISTSSAAAQSDSYPPPRTQTSAHPHQARSTLSSSSASSCRRDRESLVCNAPRGIHRATPRPVRSPAPTAACCKAAAQTRPSYSPTASYRSDSHCGSVATCPLIYRQSAAASCCIG